MNTYESKCSYCNKLLKKSNDGVELRLIIPEEILPKDMIKNMFPTYFKQNYYKFCNTKCFNLQILDELINKYNLALIFPKVNFSNSEDKARTEVTLRKLEQFREQLLNK